MSAIAMKSLRVKALPTWSLFSFLVKDRHYPRKSAYFSPLARVVAGFFTLQIFHFVAMHMKYEALLCRLRMSHN